MQLRILFFILISLSLSLFTNAFANTFSQSKKISHVIYITLDGVRWQDIFLDRTHFKTFWQRHAKHMNIYGDPKTSIKMEVASVPTSLPSYQSQMSGQIQPCHDNDCGRIQVETFPENLMHHFGFAKRDVAIFASWYKITFAVEHQLGTTYNNAGNKPVYDPDTNVADETMQYFNLRQAQNQNLSRLDIDTFGQAMHYLETYQPRFLWISLTDSDYAAHQKDLRLYNTILDFYDNALDILLRTLDTLKLRDKTLIIITTDHGRGNGEHWTDHGPNFPESKQTWAFVQNGALIAIDKPFHYSTLSIRPTIEGVFKKKA